MVDEKGIPGGGDPRAAYEEGFQEGLEEGRQQGRIDAEAGVGGTGGYRPPPPMGQGSDTIAPQDLGGGGPYKPPHP